MEEEGREETIARGDGAKETTEDPFAVTEIEIEEVSIDGICGVY